MRSAHHFGSGPRAPRRERGPIGVRAGAGKWPVDDLPRADREARWSSRDPLPSRMRPGAGSAGDL
ncbi:MAG: hypothetical protein ACYC61_31265 [Isosphaeraceae bacterium]